MLSIYVLVISVNIINKYYYYYLKDLEIDKYGI